MKTLMYHYVRSADPELPYFRYLHTGHLEAQLAYLGREIGFVSRNAFEQAIHRGATLPGVLLTFDDGLTEHHTEVAPLLRRFGLWGIFYVSTGVYQVGKLLDVHRIHLLIGRYGGVRCMEVVQQLITNEMLTDRFVEEFRSRTYVRQTNDEATVTFKRMLNFYISYQWREHVLDRMMEVYLDGAKESDLVKKFYLSLDDVRQMASEGHVIGSHGVRHLVMSKLPLKQQRQEIENSFDFLSSVIGKPIETFCYPYGGFHTFTAETEAILSSVGSRYAFNVDPRDITGDDLRRRPQALPRYDCNQFPFGQASMGSALAEVHRV